MAIFKRKQKDPAADAYRKMAQEAAAKKQYDFIGMDGKSDAEVEDKKSYKRAEQKFKDIISKPIEEGFLSNTNAWYPSADQESLDELHSDVPGASAKRVGWIRDHMTRRIQNSYKPDHKDLGRILEEAPLKHGEKHQLARELFHHDREMMKDRLTRPDETPHDRFHETKTSIDRVLEEMTQHRPNEENRARIREAINGFKKDQPDLHSYLKSKYRFATDDEPVKPFKMYSDKENILNHDEVMKYKDTHSFFNGRVLSKADPEYDAYDQKKYQLHPDGTINRVSAIIPHVRSAEYSHDHPFEDEDTDKALTFHHDNMYNLHGDHIANSNSHTAVQRYTHDSKDMNRYLATGKIRGPWGDDYEANHEEVAHKKEMFDRDAEDLSDGIHTSPPYAHQFHVWTGLSKSNDVGKYAARKTDDKEKLIGHFPSFVSTSLSAKEASSFAKRKETDMFPHQEVRDVMRVTIPKAYHKGMYVDKHSSTPGEREYVLDKDTTMEIHPKPLYYAKQNQLHRVWKGRPILSDEDQEQIQHRSRFARES